MESHSQRQAVFPSNCYSWQPWAGSFLLCLEVDVPPIMNGCRSQGEKESTSVSSPKASCGLLSASFIQQLFTYTQLTRRCHPQIASNSAGGERGDRKLVFKAEAKCSNRERKHRVVGKYLEGALIWGSVVRKDFSDLICKMRLIPTLQGWEILR